MDYWSDECCVTLTDVGLFAIKSAKLSCNLHQMWLFVSPLTLRNAQNRNIEKEIT